MIVSHVPKYTILNISYKISIDKILKYKNNSWIFVDFLELIDIFALIID